MRTSKHRHWRYRPTLRDRVEEAAARVIESVSKTCPADAALRKFFRSGSSFEKDHSSDIAGAVFAYYRWLGWCDQEATKSEQVRVATTLALEFSKTPQGFKNAELKAKVVPGWVHGLIKPPPSWWRNLQSPAAIFLRQRRSAKGSFGELELKDVRPGPRSALEFLGTEDLYRHRGFQSGDFDIQDVSSQAVSEICAPQPGEKWWDLFIVAINAKHSISVIELMRRATEERPRQAALINNLNEQAAESKIVSVLFLSLGSAGRKNLTDRFPDMMIATLSLPDLKRNCDETFYKPTCRKLERFKFFARK